MQAAHSQHKRSNTNTSSAATETDNGCPLKQALLRPLELRLLLLQLVAVLLHLQHEAVGARTLLAMG